MLKKIYAKKIYIYARKKVGHPGYGWRLRLSLGWGEVEMSWSWGRCRIWGECG